MRGREGSEALQAGPASTHLLGGILPWNLRCSVFLTYYAKPTFEQWQRKTNPAYPPPEKVRDEILQTLKGLVTATICPALALFLAQHGGSQAYCGVGEHGWSYLLVSFLASWIFVDFYGGCACPLPSLRGTEELPPVGAAAAEFYYHHLGHVYPFFWEQHKAHHVFSNPSPFAVIADEVVDQFVGGPQSGDLRVHRHRLLCWAHPRCQVRSAPLLFIPILVPINIDMLFVMFAL